MSYIIANFLAGIKECDWSLGTSFYLILEKQPLMLGSAQNYPKFQRKGMVYYVLKVFHSWKIWLQLADMDEKKHFITTELYKDTILMCSSLVQIALMFKLFFPNKAFMPWKWSEYLMEATSVLCGLSLETMINPQHQSTCKECKTCQCSRICQNTNLQEIRPIKAVGIIPKKTYMIGPWMNCWQDLSFKTKVTKEYRRN